MAETFHSVLFLDSRELDSLPDESVHLILTSPPYPMIAMWDDLFARLNPGIGKSLEASDGVRAFALMHGELDRVWRHCLRLLVSGGIAAVNVGDALRHLDDSSTGRFRLFSNSSRVIRGFAGLGFDVLPSILWRKQMNAPNKFMGSGMLPCNAYVTLEHEYILLFRKEGKRIFGETDARLRRRESAFFWEERNRWFSEAWDFKGVRQVLDSDSRPRSGAYPLELAYRLINMYSIRGDTVLDPFLGTGTTTYAAMAAERNSIGVEIDTAFKTGLCEDGAELREVFNTRIARRFGEHENFLKSRGPMKYRSRYYGFPVMTSQETDIAIRYVQEICDSPSGSTTADPAPPDARHFTVRYSPFIRTRKPGDLF